MGYNITVLNTDDASLIFYTRDGLLDYTLTNSTIVLTNAIGGNGIKLTNGSMTWDDLSLTTYMYVFDDGSEIKHYGYANGVLYVNGVVNTDAQPITITATGVSGVTGTIIKLSIFDKTKSAEYIKINYEEESKYW